MSSFEDALKAQWPEGPEAYNGYELHLATFFWNAAKASSKPLNEWAREIHENAVAHGWWEEKRNFGEMIALMHSEFSEALEEWREHKPALYMGAHTHAGTDCFDPNCRVEKPEGWAVEIVDGIIRALDTIYSEGVDVEEIMRLKTEYNKTRPYRHGNKRA